MWHIVRIQRDFSSILSEGDPDRFWMATHRLRRNFVVCGGGSPIILTTRRQAAVLLLHEAAYYATGYAGRGIGQLSYLRSGITHRLI